jgi:FkbM family methyltransferase
MDRLSRVPASSLKRFVRSLTRPVTAPLDGRVADVNRRLGSVNGNLAELGEQLTRNSAANATTIAESTTYMGVELRRFDETLSTLREGLEATQRQLDEQLRALAERAYAERLTNAWRAPLLPALEGGQQLDRPLVLVDVGCRWGIPDAWKDRAADLRVYAFDADAEECARLQAQAPDGVTYVPIALGERNESAVLHIAADPGCSSVFSPEQRALETFPELSTLEKVGERSVSLQTLDEWAAASSVDVVDVMKLDVQGAELGVLRGAEQLLRRVRLLELEVTFNPIYEGQPLFSEVDAYLRDRGFQLWRLSHLVHYANRAQQDVDVKRVDRQFFDSVPVEFPVGAGQLTWGHAYYCAPELAGGGWSSGMEALRDACAADLFGFQELVQPALHAARAFQPDSGVTG